MCKVSNWGCINNKLIYIQYIYIFEYINTFNRISCFQSAHFFLSSGAALFDLLLSVFDSAVDIREIKEIRPGQKSRDFDRHGDDSSIRVEPAYCFVILYGTEFRLKSLSLAGKKLIYISLYFLFFFD